MLVTLEAPKYPNINTPDRPVRLIADSKSFPSVLSSHLMSEAKTRFYHIDRVPLDNEEVTFVIRYRCDGVLKGVFGLKNPIDFCMDTLHRENPGLRFTNTLRETKKVPHQFGNYKDYDLLGEIAISAKAYIWRRFVPQIFIEYLKTGKRKPSEQDSLW